MRPYPRGITRSADGWRTQLMIDGTRYRQHWPPDTPLESLTTWLEQTRARHTLGLALEKEQPPPTFAEDVRTYLEAVRTMPTYSERARDLSFWVEAFGDRPRTQITAADIRRVRERWLSVGPRMRQVRGEDAVVRWTPHEEPLAASTVNHRLRALANVWTVLGGRHAPNPVREVPEAQEPDAEPRAVEYATIRALLADIEPGVTHARLSLMAYAGLPPATIARIKSQHVDTRAKTLWIAGRRKGHGSDARVIPLIPEALAALKELTEHNGWGEYSTSSARMALVRACRRLGVKPIRPYDLRHSWLTVAASSGDERAVQELAGHQDIRTTRRYTLASVAQRVAGALAAAKKETRRRRRPARVSRTARKLM